jgi:hypothetical protein
VRELNEAELDALIDEATVDAYSEDEQLAGFAVMIGDNLAVPFETTILGVTVGDPRKIASLLETKDARGSAYGWFRS